MMTKTQSNEREYVALDFFLFCVLKNHYESRVFVKKVGYFTVCLDDIKIDNISIKDNNSNSIYLMSKNIFVSEKRNL